MNNWIKSIVFGGIAAVAALLSDNHDFNWTGQGALHILEVFIGGAAGAFLLINKAITTTK